MQQTINPDQVIYGNADAKVTLVKFGDFQCPACASAHRIVQPLKEKYKDEIKFVYVHLPLTNIHPRALPAALAVEAAGMQGKYWEYYNVLYSNTDRLSDADFEMYAELVGIDVNKFKEDIKSSEIREKVNRDQRRASNLRIAATPTFFINGESININSFFDIEDLLIQKITEAYPEKQISSLDLKSTSINNTVNINVLDGEFSESNYSAGVGQTIRFTNLGSQLVEITQTAMILPEFGNKLSLDAGESFELVLFRPLETIFTTNTSDGATILRVRATELSGASLDLEDMEKLENNQQTIGGEDAQEIDTEETATNEAQE